jgi:hypothetical protein
MQYQQYDRQLRIFFFLFCHLIALIPLWIDVFPPLYDYPAHLLEVALAMDLAQGGARFGSGFVERAGWMADTNALATLAQLGLSWFVPLDVAGRLVLSVCVLLMVAGLAGLWQRRGTLLLLPLALLLAYNYTFTSGWLNFSLALGLALIALHSYERWQEHPTRHRWLVLVLLFGLIYTAHVLVWGLLALTLGVRAVADRLTVRQQVWLWTTSMSVVPLVLLAGRPLLLGLLLIGPLAGLAALLIARLRLPCWALIAGAPLAALLLFLLTQLSLPWLQKIDPELQSNRFARMTFPLRSFTLTHQLPTPDPWLSAANSLIVVLLAGLTLALVLALRQTADAEFWRRMAPVGAVLVLYGLVPSAAADIAVVEPRLLLWMALLTLTAIRLPQGGRLVRVIGGLSLALGIVAISAFSMHSVRYQAQAREWQAALRTLAPAPYVLVLPQPRLFSATNALRFIESYYDSSYFSAYYALEYTSVTTRVFGNGPAYLRPDLEVAVYLWQPSDAAAPFSTACEHTRERFTAVLTWGALARPQTEALVACFGPPREAAGLLFWE